MEGSKFEASMGGEDTSLLRKKKKKASWHTSIIPTVQEAEVEKS